MRGMVDRCLNQCFDTACNIVNPADKQGYMTGEIKVESLKPLVRVIDDDDAMRRSWAFLIEGEGWDVAVYSDALDFISSGDFQRPGCLVLDVRMPRMSGLELQDKMRELGIDLPIIFISGHGDIDMAVRTLKLGAVDFLQKPVDDQRLLTAIGCDEQPQPPPHGNGTLLLPQPSDAAHAARTRSDPHGRPRHEQ